MITMFKPCSGAGGEPAAMIRHVSPLPAWDCATEHPPSGPVRPAGLLAAAALVLVSACTPRVIVETPSDPITINLNVKIDQEVRVKLDKEVEELIANNPDLF